ncbi:histidine phosphatase family protein [Streptomyces sp. YIM S03343]
MTSRVILISPAFSTALREARFYDNTPLDPAGLRAARSAADAFPAPGRVRVSPGVRCRETADALGLTAVETPELAGLDAGRWHGLSLTEVSAREPEALATWLSDPTAAPHGGESVRELCTRVGRWLESAESGRLTAVVEPEVVRAAVLLALGAPETAFWRVDVPPLTAVELSGRSNRWNLRPGRPLAD